MDATIFRIYQPLRTVHERGFWHGGCHNDPYPKGGWFSWMPKAQAAFEKVKWLYTAVFILTLAFYCRNRYSNVYFFIWVACPTERNYAWDNELLVIKAVFEEQAAHLWVGGRTESVDDQPQQLGIVLRTEVPLSPLCCSGLFLFMLPFHFPLTSRKQNAKADGKRTQTWMHAFSLNHFATDTVEVHVRSSPGHCKQPASSPALR